MFLFSFVLFVKVCKSIPTQMTLHGGTFPVFLDGK